LFFSTDAAIDVYLSWNMTSAGLFGKLWTPRWECETSAFFRLGSCWLLVHCTAPSLFLGWKF